MKTVQGSELKVGDTIEVWWTPRRDTITALRPYMGLLEYLWPGGARIAEFALLKSGMTVGPDEDFKVLNR